MILANLPHHEAAFVAKVEEKCQQSVKVGLTEPSVAMHHILSMQHSNEHGITSHKFMSTYHVLQSMSLHRHSHPDMVSHQCRTLTEPL